IGRATRGIPGHNAIVLILNADEELRKAIGEMKWLDECAETVIYPEVGTDLEIIIDQCTRWLAAKGGDWPEPDPSKAREVDKGGRPKKTFEELARLAVIDRNRGGTYREFSRKYHLTRTLNEEEVNKIKLIYNHP